MNISTLSAFNWGLIIGFIICFILPFFIDIDDEDDEEDNFNEIPKKNQEKHNKK